MKIRRKKNLDKYKLTVDSDSCVCNSLSVGVSSPALVSATILLINLQQIKTHIVKVVCGTEFMA